MALGRFFVAFYKRDWQTALDALATTPHSTFTSEGTILPKELLVARVCQLRGEPDRAREAYDLARIFLEGELKERPAQEGYFRGPLGMALAGLGRKAEAVREAKLGIELFPATDDVIVRRERIETLAYVYVLVGEYDAALDQIDRLLSVPSGLSVALLRLDPRWDPLRDHPRYQELLQRYAPAPEEGATP
jgi:serine/threonine-protein kinase